MKFAVKQVAAHVECCIGSVLVRQVVLCGVMYACSVQTQVPITSDCADDAVMCKAARLVIQQASCNSTR